MYNYEILSAIPLWEIVSFFEKLCSCEDVDYQYFGDGWQVWLVPLEPISHGVITLPQTKIEFSGNEEVCKIIVEKYRKAFMRGGA